MFNNYQSQFPKKHNHDSRFDEDILIFSLFLSSIITINVVMLPITELSSSAKSVFFLILLFDYAAFLGVTSQC